MSRGFVKEGDSEEIPMVAPRAFLPDGAINYVTPEGLKDLENERDELTKERDEVETNPTLINETDKRIHRNFITAKLHLLEERINTAVLIKPEDESEKDYIHFGSTIELTMNAKKLKLQITGVDQADISKAKISYLSPLAQSLLAKKPGETFDITLPAGKRSIKILRVL